MNENKPDVRTIAEFDAIHNVPKVVQSAALVAGHRLNLGDRPELVLNELRAAVDRAFAELKKPVAEDQKIQAQHVGLPSGGLYVRIGDREKITVPVVTNSDLRYSIERTIYELRGELAAGLSVSVSDRLEKHLDCLLNAEAARVITIIDHEKGEQS